MIRQNRPWTCSRWSECCSPAGSCLRPFPVVRISCALSSWMFYHWNKCRSAADPVAYLETGKGTGTSFALPQRRSCWSPRYPSWISILWCSWCCKSKRCFQCCSCLHFSDSFPWNFPSFFEVFRWLRSIMPSSRPASSKIFFLHPVYISPCATPPCPCSFPYSFPPAAFQSFCLSNKGSPSAASGLLCPLSGKSMRWLLTFSSTFHFDWQLTLTRISNQRLPLWASERCHWTLSA